MDPSDPYSDPYSDESTFESENLMHFG